jgi:hypothetical protein
MAASSQTKSIRFGEGSVNVGRVSKPSIRAPNVSFDGDSCPKQRWRQSTNPGHSA